MNPTIAPTQESEAEQLRGWLPETFAVRVFMQHDVKHGAWYAVSIDYDIVSMGASQHEALGELRDQMVSYFLACMRDGDSFAAARRPVPATRRAKYAALVGIASAKKRLTDRGDGASSWKVPVDATDPSHLRLA